MRPFVTPVVLLAALAGQASADAVHLKNGDVIYADQVTESDTKVEYSVGDNTFTIPKSRVERIERGGAVPARTGDLPTYIPSAPLANEEHLLDKVIQDGGVNRQALNALESRGNSRETAIAYYIAAKQEFQNGKFAEARRDFEAALHNDPQNPTIVNFYAALLIKTGNAQQGVDYGERATRLAPDSADAFAVLGFAQYASGHLKEAIQSLNHSLALRPDLSVQRFLERALREASLEKNYAERETGHFTLRYEGRQSSESFRNQILETLESEYTDLAQGFGVQPRSSIEVILYTNQAFFDVTQAPYWAGAVNDGKLRIPVQGLDTVSSDLARILKHELAHSFVAQLSMGRCPRWLNEGIAQAMEPRSLAGRGARLADLFKQEQAIPLNVLEGNFNGFSAGQAMLAYDESLAAVDYIRSSYGMSDVMRVLERLGQGESAESALRATVHSDYRQLYYEIGRYLGRQYGN